MKHSLLLLFLLPAIAFGQTTLIPDANFEQALIDLGYDTGTPDGSVPTANISGVDSLNVPSNSISDLTGIADFTALTYLDCGYNQLTALNISQNTMLNKLECEHNALTNLDVSQNTALSYLGCDDNQLTSLDVSQNIALERLGCFSNQFLGLDLSQNTALEGLDCRWNPLVCLNVSNGNNTSFAEFDATSNPSLLCIQVDDTAYSNANWWGVYFDFDPQTTFSEDCNNPCSTTTGIPEPPTKPKELLTITDILGRTTQPKPNTLLFYLYEDGSVEKRIQLER